MQKAKTLLIAYPGCIYLEAAHAVSILSTVSDIVVATPDGKPARVGEGWMLAGDCSFAHTPKNVFKCIVIPGGDIYSVKDHLDLDILLQRGHRNGSILGGICNGGLLIAKSGLLKHRQITHTAIERYAPRPEFAELLAYAEPHIADTTYVDRDVVVDSNIVTAKPWASIAFGAQLASMCGALDAGTSQSWTQYQHGKRDL